MQVRPNHNRTQTEIVADSDQTQAGLTQSPAPSRPPARERSEPLPARLPPAASAANHPCLSIVIPVFDEVDSLLALYQGLVTVLAEMDRRSEIIFVDDGSRDGSHSVLQELFARDPRVQVIEFRRNFGQTAAFAAGFAQARGDTVVTLDADLQNDPADIPRLLQKLDEGYDIVSGWRVERKDHFLTRKLPSRVANAVISRITGVRLHDYGCSLKAYRRDVVKNIRLYGEMHRFIPALASWMGVRVAEVPVNHAPRRFGRSKYGLWRTTKVFLDLLTVKFLLDYGTRPIQVFGLLGMLCFVAGTAAGSYLSVLKLVFGEPLADRPLLLLAVLLVVLGVQLISMGLLGELIIRTYHESQDKPTYLVRTVHRHPEPEGPREAPPTVQDRIG